VLLLNETSLEGLQGWRALRSLVGVMVLGQSHVALGKGMEAARRKMIEELALVL
jgi:hypothetical protein